MLHTLVEGNLSTYGKDRSPDGTRANTILNGFKWDDQGQPHTATTVVENVPWLYSLEFLPA